MSKKDDIWSYLIRQSEIDEDSDDGICDPLHRPTSFSSFLQNSSVFSSKCQFIVVGKVTYFRKIHPELRPWRSGYLCFFSLNFEFEAKNLELIVSLRESLHIPINIVLIPHVVKYPGTKKDAADDMNRYFKQYINHVVIKGVSLVILSQHDLVFVRSFLSKINMAWVDKQHERWERIRPSGLISE